MRVPSFVQIWTMAAVAVPVCTVLAIFGDDAANFVNARIVTPAKSYVNRHRPHMHVMRPHAHETP